MESGTLGDIVNPWGVATFRTLKTVEPKSASEQAAYAKWLDQRSDRESARQDRIHGAEGVIPVPLWIVLLLSAVTIFVFMLFFADSAEGVGVQATMMGGVAIVISSTLLLLWFLDHPYNAGIGSLRPVAMERAIRILDQEAAIDRWEAHDPVRRARDPDRRLRSTSCLQTSSLRRRLFARQRAPDCGGAAASDDRRERTQGRSQPGPENFSQHCRSVEA